MLISDFTLDHIQIPLKTAFKHARYKRTKTDAIIVCLRTAEGLTGYGEILPRNYVTGETIEHVLKSIGPCMGARFIGNSFSSKDEVILFLRQELELAGRNLATFCGFELALLDLAGQALEFAIADVLGSTEHTELPAGIVIGLEVETKVLPKYCAILRFSDKRHIKVKIGVADDLERLTIIADILKTPIRLDANGAWSSADDAIRALSDMMAIPIASIEQPLTPGDFEGARQIRKETGLLVMADEAVCTLADAEHLIEQHAADIFNIRLGKCGGVLGSLRLVERAKEAGIRCHLGTLVGETGILTRATEVFSRFVPGFECLDGKGQNAYLLEEDILDNPHDAVSAAFTTEGLGIRVSADRLLDYTVSERKSTIPLAYV